MTFQRNLSQLFSIDNLNHMMLFIVAMATIWFMNAQVSSTTESALTGSRAIPKCVKQPCLLVTSTATFVLSMKSQ